MKKGMIALTLAAAALLSVAATAPAQADTSWYCKTC